MSSQAKPDTTLCVNFCAYYKPGRNEELMCQGFAVVRGLLRSGRRIGLARPQRIAAPDRAATEGLKERVCAACSFRVADCDFIETNGEAAPCGGFLLLSHLLGTKALTLDEIGKDAAERS